MLITTGKSAKKGVRKRTLKRGVTVGPLSLRFMTIIMLAAVALFYLAQSTQSATKTYTIGELDREKQELLKEKERLEIESTRLKSLSNIKQDIEDLGLEE